MKLTDLLLGHRKRLSSDVRTIMVLNTKGGSGKTTVATNLASYYATQGIRVSLADFDPQASSLAWLRARPSDRPPIDGLAAWKEPLWIPNETRCVIMDVPAGLDLLTLRRLIARAQTLVVPVLPSPIDMRSAADLVERLLGLRSVAQGKTRVAVMANRVRERTTAYETLEEFLRELELPFVARLRDSQNYIQAAERGLGIFELPSSAAANDLAEWEPLLKWLRSKRALPTAFRLAPVG
jgi:chromosome partitioning protein